MASWIWNTSIKSSLETKQPFTIQLHTIFSHVNALSFFHIYGSLLPKWTVKCEAITCTNCLKMDGSLQLNAIWLHITHLILCYLSKYSAAKVWPNLWQLYSASVIARESSCSCAHSQCLHSITVQSSEMCNKQYVPKLNIMTHFPKLAVHFDSTAPAHTLFTLTRRRSLFKLTLRCSSCPVEQCTRVGLILTEDPCPFCVA